MLSLTSRCRSPDAESSDALLTDCLYLAPDVIPIFKFRGSVVKSFKHADLDVTCTLFDQLACKYIKRCHLPLVQLYGVCAMGNPLYAGSAPRPKNS